MPAAYRFDHLRASDGWLSPGWITVDDGGWIVDVGGEAPGGDETAVAGIAVPGMPNLHSHAFQRAMAGLTEHRTGADEDSFWTWRELMYRFVDRLGPDDLEAIAAQLYVEMLKAGYTAVGEFQYLHHDRDGAPYAERAEMSLRLLAAARAAGIGVTLLPVLYQSGGFGGAPTGDGQRRFVNDLDGYLRLRDGIAAAVAGDPQAAAGIAPHSLRAVGPEALSQAVAAVDPAEVVHVHIAEQVKEVADCEAWCGRRPVEWLLDNAEVDSRWCLVHATHMTAAETREAARSGAVAGLCPTTEANLGDGLFGLVEWTANGGAWGIGSDSHVSVDPVEELRWLEYGQRLRDRRRNVAAGAGESTGATLFDAAAAGGAQALGRPIGAIAPGRRADVVVLDAEAPVFAGMTRDRFLDGWIFAGTGGGVRDVMCGGRWVVEDGRHPDETRIADRYRSTVAALMAA